MTELVTIAIPCRDCEAWVGIAIGSALAQEGEGIEVDVVVADDGSRDASRERVREFGDRVRLIALPGGGGANAARNAALEAARGRWIQFLDADDYLLKGKIARQLGEAGASADGAAMLYGPTHAETWRDGRAVARTVIGIDPEAGIVRQWISWQMPQTGGALWRRSALEALGGWNEASPCCQEHELYLRAIKAGVRMVFTPTPGAVYRLWSEETLCRRDPRLTIAERSRLIDAMLDWVRETGGDDASARQAAGRAFFEMSRTLAGIDLDEAAAYFAAHLRRGLIRMEGPAAPTSYRAVCALLGFRAAERVAGALRGRKS